MKNEIWKDVVGYEGLYQISNFGNIRSLNYGKRGYTKLMKPHCNKRNGYVQISLSNNQKQKTKKIHRLVLEAFVGVNKNSDVNHKDGNKQNNNLNNLEYCSRQYNIRHAYDNKLNRSRIKSVNQYDSNGKFIKKWDSQREICNYYGISEYYLSKYLNGKIDDKLYNGFIWKYDLKGGSNE